VSRALRFLLTVASASDGVEFRKSGGYFRSMRCFQQPLEDVGRSTSEVMTMYKDCQTWISKQMTQRYKYGRGIICSHCHQTFPSPDHHCYVQVVRKRTRTSSYSSTSNANKKTECTCRTFVRRTEHATDASTTPVPRVEKIAKSSSPERRLECFAKWLFQGYDGHSCCAISSPSCSRRVTFPTSSTR